MASYNAQINLLISGQKELDRLAGRLQAIERQIVDINRLGVSPQQRDPVSGRFGADPDRQNRVALARLANIGKQESARASVAKSYLREQNAELLNSIKYQSKLNAAVDLYQRKLEELSRGGGGKKLTEELRGQVDEIQRAFEVATAGGTKNLGLVRSLATELGRVVERQNEINRLSTFQSKAFFQAQTFERRMAELRSRGASASAFGGVGRQMSNYRSAITRGSEFEATDIARRIKEALNRIARELDNSVAEARELAQAANRSLRSQQDQRDAQQRLRKFFDDATNQALAIEQNAKNTRAAWQNFFEDATTEAVRLREQVIQSTFQRLNALKNLRGNSDAYDQPIGPLEAGKPGSPRYFQEAQQIAKELLDVENEIAGIREGSMRESLRLESERLELVNKRKQKEQEIKNVVLDAVSFGKSQQINKMAGNFAAGSRNALVRGGLGIGALGIGGLYEGIGNLGSANLGPLNALKGPVGAIASTISDSIGSSVNAALGGVPAIVGNILSGLGDIPAALGLATVAAYAFAPAIKEAASAVLLAGQKFGESKFGENIKLTLDRQTNVFESVINKASEMNMVLNASKSGLDAVGQKIKSLPALPAAGQTSFAGEVRRGRGGVFMGGGAREITNPEFLANAAGEMAQRTEMAADASLLFASGLGQAADSAKTISDYLKEANSLRTQVETKAQRFIRESVERGRELQQNQASAEEVRRRSQFLVGAPYSLAQVPAGGELFPGGRTETRQPGYREMLNTAARVSQIQEEILNTMSKQQGFVATIGQLERRAINDKGRSLKFQQEENAELERSIQIIRERNSELRSRPVASMTPQERVSSGILDPNSLRAQRLRRVEIGRLDPLERFYAGFQPRRRAARSARATSEGLIGGAFPLLFGQGTGAAVGGGLGGFAGGFAGGGLGFGLSLIGTAAGTAIDTFMTNLKGLADSLNDPTAALEAMKTAGLTVSKEIDRTVKSLESSGNAYGAQLIVLKELERQLGTGSVKQLQALSVAQKKLDELTGSLSAKITSSLLPAIIGFTDYLNLLISGLSILASMKPPGLPSDRENSLLLQPADAMLAFAAMILTGPAGGLIAGGASMRGRSLAEQQSGKPDVQEKTMREAQLQAYQKQLETMDLGKSVTDQARQAAREQRDLDRQNADLVRSYEESLGQLRQSIEDEVARRRFMILEKENELLDLQGENRLKQLEIFNTKAISEAGAGQLPEVEAVAKEVATIVADFTQNQLSAEEEAAKIKRKAALDARQLDFEAAKFKIGIEKELSRLNIETARQVASINEQVVRRNEDANENRLLIEKAIAVVQLQLASSNAQKDKQIAEEYLKSVPKGTREEEFAANIFKTRSEILAQTNEALQRVQAVQPPGKLKRLPGVRLGGVSTTELDSLLSDQKQAINAAVEESLKGFDLTKALNIEEFKSKVNNLANTIEKPLADIGRAMGKEQARNIRYMQLVRSGASEAAASKIIEVEQQTELTDLTYKAAIAEVKKRRDVEGTSEAQKSIFNTVIAELKARRETIPGVAIGLTTSIMEKEGEGGRIQTQADAAEEQLNRLISMSYQVTEAAKAIGSAFSDSFKGVVNGTMTAQEALGSFFQNIADYFLDMATQIISKWIEMTILNSVLKLFPSGNLSSPSAGGGDFASAWSSVSGQGAMGYLNAGPQIFANGGAFAQNGIVPFAMGGIVNSPTLFKFADGGAMRNGLMGEAGPEAIMPLKRGPGGRLGVEASGGGGSVAVTVHVDASGSKVAGEDTQANQLGRVIAAAVQSELVKQKRPGGLLS